MKQPLQNIKAQNESAAASARLRPDENTAPPTGPFADLGLIAPLLRALREEGYETPTPIQVQAIPPVLEGRDVLGCALATDPEIMLFDEPTSALDPIATVNIEELMSGLKDKLSILVVTHNMQQAARISDYTAYMYLGEMIEFDETNKIFTNPSKKETEDYITGKFG